MILALLFALAQDGFVERHCVDCHGPDLQKAQLRLDTLPPDSPTWIRAFERVRNGEMPPRGPRPEPKDVEAFRSQLHRDSLARQQRDGRVVLRRLNRTEVENCLRDLLGLRVDVRDLLPEDNSVAGFDTVSEGLDISSAHLLCYQEAAEKALAAALRFRPQPPETRRLTASQLAGLRGVKGQLGKYFVFKGDALVMHTKVPPYTEVWTPGAPVGGRYRVRVSCSGVGASIPVAFHRVAGAVAVNRDVPACLDAPADRPGVLEIDVELRQGENILVNGWTLPHHPDFDRAHKNRPRSFDGPGLAIEWIEIEGPLDRVAGNGYDRLFGSKDPGKLLGDFVPRAARRPLPPSEIEPFVRFAKSRLERGVGFEEAMLAAYKAVLCSPHFLFVVEAPGKLDDHALATRLSLFLWRSMPDGGPADVERLLRDPKARRFIDDFTGQWLDLRNLNATSPDPDLYPDFDPYLLWSMQQETRMFFAEVLERDLDVAAFVHSDWSFLNERLARHYGIPGISGSAPRKAPLPDGAHRGGVLTQASVLKVTADGTRTSPILRGKWVLDRILGKSPPPPPPGISAIDPDIRGATTILQQLEKHRNSPACASCHRHIDPPGFALESFDAVGAWRDFYRLPKGKRGPDVDRGDFKGVDEFRKTLLQDREQLARNLIQKLLIFATGADLQFADREEVEKILGEVRKSGYGLRSILRAVVASPVFRNK